MQIRFFNWRIKGGDNVESQELEAVSLARTDQDREQGVGAVSSVLQLTPRLGIA